MALKQSHAQLSLEPGNVLTDGRLGAAQLAGERAQVTGFAGRDQDPQVFEGHAYI
jgi:hypothetical protein